MVKIEYDEDDFNDLAVSPTAARAITKAFNDALPVQCADCSQWFDRNQDHTCKAQIRRNKRFETPKE